MEEYAFKKTKIVATVGPASRDREILKKLILSGVDVFRLNFSHGNHEDHLTVISEVRDLNEELGTHVCLLQDLQGPKIRTGVMDNGGVEIKSGGKLVITTEEVTGSSDLISTSYKALAKDVTIGNIILIDDGKIELRVESKSDVDVETTVVHGGILKSKKGINLPDTRVSAPSLTEKDEIDLKFGLKHNVDWIALSFVRSAQDINYLKKKIEITGRTTKIIAKIEKPEALDNLESIIESADGLMVARGDLGVEIPSERVPVMQKRMVKMCNKVGKPVIIATQMLESMIENPRPTRAETNDVANGVLDGADAVMLSAESAAGKYPVESVKSMSKIVKAVEATSRTIYNKFYDEEEDSSTHLNDLLVRASCRLSDAVRSKAIIGLTKTGYTAFRISMHRPKAPIIIFTDRKHILRQMNLIWGVRGFYYDEMKGIDETLEDLEKILKKEGVLLPGDVYINTASMPLHWKSHTNMVKIGVTQ